MDAPFEEVGDLAITVVKVVGDVPAKSGKAAPELALGLVLAQEDSPFSFIKL